MLFQWYIFQLFHYYILLCWHIIISVFELSLTFTLLIFTLHFNMKLSILISTEPLTLYCKTVT